MENEALHLVRKWTRSVLDRTLAYFARLSLHFIPPPTPAQTIDNMCCHYTSLPQPHLHKLLTTCVVITLHSPTHTCTKYWQHVLSLHFTPPPTPAQTIDNMCCHYTSLPHPHLHKLLTTCVVITLHSPTHTCTNYWQHVLSLHFTPPPTPAQTIDNMCCHYTSLPQPHLHKLLTTCVVITLHSPTHTCTKYWQHVLSLHFTPPPTSAQTIDNMCCHYTSLPQPHLHKLLTTCVVTTLHSPTHICTNYWQHVLSLHFTPPPTSAQTIDNMCCHYTSLPQPHLHKLLTTCVVITLHSPSHICTNYWQHVLSLHFTPPPTSAQTIDNMCCHYTSLPHPHLHKLLTTCVVITLHSPTHTCTNYWQHVLSLHFTPPATPAQTIDNMCCHYTSLPQPHLHKLLTTCVVITLHSPTHTCTNYWQHVLSLHFTPPPTSAQTIDNMCCHYTSLPQPHLHKLLTTCVVITLHSPTHTCTKYWQHVLSLHFTPPPTPAQTIDNMCCHYTSLPHPHLHKLLTTCVVITLHSPTHTCTNYWQHVLSLHFTPPPTPAQTIDNMCCHYTSLPQPHLHKLLTTCVVITLHSPTHTCTNYWQHVLSLHFTPPPTSAQTIDNMCCHYTSLPQPHLHKLLTTCVVTTLHSPTHICTNYWQHVLSLHFTPPPTSAQTIDNMCCHYTSLPQPHLHKLLTTCVVITLHSPSHICTNYWQHVLSLHFTPPPTSAQTIDNMCCHYTSLPHPHLHKLLTTCVVITLHSPTHTCTNYWQHVLSLHFTPPATPAQTIDNMCCHYTSLPQPHLHKLLTTCVVITLHSPTHICTNYWQHVLSLHFTPPPTSAQTIDNMCCHYTSLPQPHLHKVLTTCVVITLHSPSHTCTNYWQHVLSLHFTPPATPAQTIDNMCCNYTSLPHPHLHKLLTTCVVITLHSPTHICTNYWHVLSLHFTPPPTSVQTIDNMCCHYTSLPHPHLYKLLTTCVVITLHSPTHICTNYWQHVLSLHFTPPPTSVQTIDNMCCHYTSLPHPHLYKLLTTCVVITLHSPSHICTNYWQHVLSLHFTPPPTPAQTIDNMCCHYTSLPHPHLHKLLTTCVVTTLHSPSHTCTKYWQHVLSLHFTPPPTPAQSIDNMCCHYTSLPHPHLHKLLTTCVVTTLHSPTHTCTKYWQHVLSLHFTPPPTSVQTIDNMCCHYTSLPHPHLYKVLTTCVVTTLHSPTHICTKYWQHVLSLHFTPPPTSARSIDNMCCHYTSLPHPHLHKLLTTCVVTTLHSPTHICTNYWQHVLSLHFTPQPHLHKLLTTCVVTTLHSPATSAQSIDNMCCHYTSLPTHICTKYWQHVLSLHFTPPPTSAQSIDNMCCHYTSLPHPHLHKLLTTCVVTTLHSPATSAQSIDNMCCHYTSLPQPHLHKVLTTCVVITLHSPSNTCTNYWQHVFSLHFTPPATPAQSIDNMCCHYTSLPQPHLHKLLTTCVVITLHSPSHTCTNYWQHVLSLHFTPPSTSLQTIDNMSI